jgi:hypothetical protein
MAENFWAAQAKGVPLESSALRSSEALERWCLVLAMTPLSLVSLGTSVVQPGTRRFGDPHWFRGARDLQIGWKWVSYALSRDDALIASVYLSSESDPEPAIAARKHAQQRQHRFGFAYQEAA